MYTQFLQNILKSVATDLNDAFDRNLERKAFFGEAWPKNKFINQRGSELNRTGTLRRSISYTTSGNRITFVSNVPYASIHNNGGVLVITRPMQKFFWAKFLQLGGAKGGAEALQFKYLALKKVGDQIVIPQRQFIGDHPQVHQSITAVVNHEIKLLNQEILKQLKR